MRASYVGAIRRHAALQILQAASTRAADLREPVRFSGLSLVASCQEPGASEPGDANDAISDENVSGGGRETGLQSSSASIEGAILPRLIVIASGG